MHRYTAHMASDSIDRLDGPSRRHALTTEKSPVDEVVEPERELNCLVVQECPDAMLVGTRVALRQGAFVLGRSRGDTSRVEEAVLWLADDQVSEVHAVIRLDDGEVTVTDCGSTNGCRVGDAHIQSGERRRVIWKAGQFLRIGQTRLKGLCDRDPEAKSYTSLQHRSFTDKLTGVFNREYLALELDRSIVVSERTERPLSVCMVDIDHFKRVNDTHGHEAGDDVLAAFARCIEGRLRGTDLLARYGGEEFIILFQEVGIEQACTIAEEIRSRIEEVTVPFKDMAIRVTASLGVAERRHDETGKDLLGRADKQMYMAKESGRNRVCG